MKKRVGVLKKSSIAPGTLWCVIAGLCDIALVAYLDMTYWSRLAKMGIVLSIVVPAGVVFSFLWSLTLSDRLRSAVHENESETAGSGDQSEEPLYQAWLLAFHGVFFALCTVGVVLFCMSSVLGQVVHP
jgi:hypothetical protein